MRWQEIVLIPAEESRPRRVSRSDGPILGGRPTSRSSRARRLQQHLTLAAALAASALATATFTPSHALATPSSIVLMAPANQEAPGEVLDATGDTGAVEDQAVAPEAAPPAEGDAATVQPEAERPSAEQGNGSDERITPTSRGGPRPTAPSTQGPKEGEKPAGERVAAIARKYVGYPYAWGGSSPRTGFDCSGFDEYVYQEAGIPVPPHDLWGQMNSGPRIALQDLQPGDLVFFQNTYKAGLSHGGIYLGSDRFIHSIEEGVGIQVSSLGEDYWAARFLTGSRPWASSPDRGP